MFEVLLNSWIHYLVFLLSCSRYSPGKAFILSRRLLSTQTDLAGNACRYLAGFTKPSPEKRTMNQTTPKMKPLSVLETSGEAKANALSFHQTLIKTPGLDITLLVSTRLYGR